MPLPTYYKILERLPGGGYRELFASYRLNVIRQKLTQYRVAGVDVELHHNARN